MSAIGRRQESIFDELKSSAERGELSVEETFAALRSKQISEDEAKLLLDFIQRLHTPLWQRFIVGLTSGR